MWKGDVGMRKILLILIACLFLLSGCSKKEVSKTPDFDFLQRISLEELNKRVNKKETLYVYIGWTENSSECVKFQEEYLEPYIEYYGWNGMITVVDLDQDLPEALEEKSLRSELTEKYTIRYAPALIYIHFGEIKSVLEWTPETNDLTYGIDPDVVNDWMKSVSLMK